MGLMDPWDRPLDLGPGGHVLVPFSGRRIASIPPDPLQGMVHGTMRSSCILTSVPVARSATFRGCVYVSAVERINAELYKNDINQRLSSRQGEIPSSNRHRNNATSQDQVSSLLPRKAWMRPGELLLGRCFDLPRTMISLDQPPRCPSLPAPRIAQWP